MRRRSPHKIPIYLANKIMESRNFENFADASTFAKSLAQQGVVHNLKRNGALWVVEHENTRVIPPPKEVDVQPLLRKIYAQESKIESLEQANSNLQSKLDTLVSNIRKQVAEQTAKDKKALKEKKSQLTKEISRIKAAEANIPKQVAEQTAKDKKALEEKKSQLTEEISRVKAAEAALATKKHKLELFEKAYADRFGEAEVGIVKKRVESIKARYS